MSVAEKPERVDTAVDTSEAAVTAPRLTVIEPRHGWRALGVKELWQHRELFYFLAWRDVKVRYQQTAIGILWAIIQPIATVAIFTLLFGHFTKLPSETPYALLVFSGMLPWLLFTQALTASSLSLVINNALVTKVYVPRLVIPTAAAIPSLVDFVLGFVVFMCLMAWYGVTPTWAIVTLPLFVLLALATALSVGIWFAALNVRYRDIQYVIPFLTQIWLFVTPVVYSATLIPEHLRIIFGLNPMTGVVQGFRWALFGDAANVGPLLAVAIAIVVVLLVTGLAYFRRVERVFADMI